MANITFGEVSWGEEVGPSKDKRSSKDEWMKLKNGSNEVRIVTEIYQYSTHKYKVPGSKGFGTKINCSSANGSCPVCDAVELMDEEEKKQQKAKSRYLFGVISRGDAGAYKIMDVSFGVIKDINGLVKKSDRWGHPSKYDIDIIKDETAAPNDYYSVQPVAKEPLSAADQMVKDRADIDRLKALSTPPEVSRVKDLMDKEHKRAAETGVVVKTTSKVVAKAKSAPAQIVDDGDDSFPPFNEA